MATTFEQMQIDRETIGKKEYARRENSRLITSNRVEGYFSLLKRGIYGTYHHVGIPYLQQYLNEFDPRRKSNHSTVASVRSVAFELFASL